MEEQVVVLKMPRVDKFVLVGVAPPYGKRTVARVGPVEPLVPFLFLSLYGPLSSLTLYVSTLDSLFSSSFIAFSAPSFFCASFFDLCSSRLRFPALTSCNLFQFPWKPDHIRDKEPVMMSDTIIAIMNPVTPIRTIPNMISLAALLNSPFRLVADAQYMLRICHELLRFVKYAHSDTRYLSERI